MKIGKYAVPNGLVYGLGIIVLLLAAWHFWPSGGDEATHEVPGVGLLTDDEYNEYLKKLPAQTSWSEVKANLTAQNQTQSGMTSEQVAKAIADALAQQKPVGTGTGVSTGGNVIAALQSRSRTAVTVNKFSTMYTASEDLGMNAPELNFDTEATKIVLLMPGEFQSLIDESVNRAFTQDDQVSNLKATLKVAFPGTVVPAIGFDVQTDGSSKIYGWEIKPDGAYTCMVYDGDVATCTDDSGSANALDMFS